MLNLDDNNSFSDMVVIEAAGLITAGRSAKRRKKTLKKPILNLPELPKLPTFNHLHPAIPPHKEWN
jgi:hypothetical protein